MEAAIAIIIKVTASLDLSGWSNCQPPHISHMHLTDMLLLCQLNCYTGCSSQTARWVVAVAVVVGLRLLAAHLDVRSRLAWPPPSSGSSEHAAAAAADAYEQSREKVSKQPGTPKGPRQHRDRDAWRKLVGSELVASAWDKLCNSIIQEVCAMPRPAMYMRAKGQQRLFIGARLASCKCFCQAPCSCASSCSRSSSSEGVVPLLEEMTSPTMHLLAALQFIYDAWFGQLSPDREFPAEVRWQLNHAFGQASRRAKRLDWTSLLIRYGTCYGPSLAGKLKHTSNDTNSKCTHHVTTNVSNHACT